MDKQWPSISISVAQPWSHVVCGDVLDLTIRLAMHGRVGPSGELSVALFRSYQSLSAAGSLLGRRVGDLRHGMTTPRLPRRSRTWQ